MLNKGLLLSAVDYLGSLLQGGQFTSSLDVCGSKLLSRMNNTTAGISNNQLLRCNQCVNVCVRICVFVLNSKTRDGAFHRYKAYIVTQDVTGNQWPSPPTRHQCTFSTFSSVPTLTCLLAAFLHFATFKAIPISRRSLLRNDQMTLGWWCCCCSEKVCPQSGAVAGQEKSRISPLCGCMLKGQLQECTANSPNWGHVALGALWLDNRPGRFQKFQMIVSFVFMHNRIVAGSVSTYFIKRRIVLSAHQWAEPVTFFQSICPVTQKGASWLAIELIKFEIKYICDYFTILIKKNKSLSRQQNLFVLFTLVTKQQIAIMISIQRSTLFWQCHLFGILLLMSGCFYMLVLIQPSTDLSWIWVGEVLRNAISGVK